MGLPELTIKYHKPVPYGVWTLAAVSLSVSAVLLQPTVSALLGPAVSLKCGASGAQLVLLGNSCPSHEQQVVDGARGSDTQNTVFLVSRWVFSPLSSAVRTCVAAAAPTVTRLALKTTGQHLVFCDPAQRS